MSYFNSSGKMHLNTFTSMTRGRMITPLLFSLNGCGETLMKTPPALEKWGGIILFHVSVYNVSHGYNKRAPLKTCFLNRKWNKFILCC